MLSSNYDLHTVKLTAKGQWKQILTALAAVPEESLDGRGHPCPGCQTGTDRFNAGKDFDETGCCFCRQCQLGGDGFTVLQQLNRWDLKSTINKVGRYLMADAMSHEQSSQPAQHRNRQKPRSGSGYPDAVAAVLQSVRSTLPAEVAVPDEPISYRYQHADGSPAGVILRWDRSDGGKEIRPLTTTSSGWVPKAMQAPRPLYRLPRIAEAQTVYVCEGEKAADAVESFELTATTSAGGSSGPGQTDWSPLIGKRVVIVPDNDAPGEKYAATVAELVAQQAPTATIEIARLSDCWTEIPDKGDAADWSEHFDSRPAEWFREELARIAGPLDIAVVKPDRQTEASAEPIADDDFQRFPVDCLPHALRGFVRQASTALGVDMSFVVLPMLAVCAAAIGRSRQAMIKAGWSAPSVLWTAIVGESGSGKSPAFRVATEPIKQRQKALWKQYTAERQQYDSDQRQYKWDLKTWQRDQNGPEPEKPTTPVHQQVVVKDTTVEGLAVVLHENERGVLLARDELSGWLASFDRYAGRSATSGDVTSWLEFYNCEQVLVNRKATDHRVLFIESPAVSVCGGVQPGILSRCLTDEHKENGLQSRLMLAYPPRQTKKWREEELPQAASEAYAELINNLFELKPGTDAEGRNRPSTLRLSDAARQLMVDFVNRHGEEQNALSGHAASQWSKLEELPARLAIVIHCVRQVSDGVPDAWALDRETIAAAVQIAEWFKTEAMRVKRLMSEDASTRNARELAHWIRGRGGRITARELRQHRRDIATTEEAEILLMDLVARKAGEWRPIHASREFVLFPASTFTDSDHGQKREP